MPETQLDRIEERVIDTQTRVTRLEERQGENVPVRLAVLEQRQNWIWGAVVASASAMVAVVVNWFSGKN